MEAKQMRSAKQKQSARLGKKQTNSENEAKNEPKAKKSQSENKMPNMDAMDNGTMVETFKYLSYYQLATNSLVSKRYRNLIRAHRHLLALLDVDEIFMNSYIAYHDHVVIEMFNEELSLKEYNKWVACNEYSKQIPLEGQIIGKESLEDGRNIYEFWAGVSQNLNHSHDIATTVFNARAELKDETWPLFQHFIRLLTDPFIYIRLLSLCSLKDVFTLLAGAMNLDRDRLQCKQLNIDFIGVTQKFSVWIKDHVRCNEILIEGYFHLNYDEKLLDFILSGAQCTSSIRVINYDLSKVLVILVQKFIGLKNRDEYQAVESTQGNVRDRAVVEELKRNYAEFIAEEEQYKDVYSTGHVIGFINHDIEKKLTLNVKNFSFGSPSFFSIRITDL